MTAATTNYPIVGLVFLILFVISLITNILGPLIPDIIKSFALSLGMAWFLPFSFFVAYGFMSIPSGMLVERYGEKAVLASAFLLAFAGSIAFALLPDFRTALASLFVIGAGMAVLQVAINPLLRVTGGDEHFTFYSVMAQLVFGLAGFVSPQIYSYLVGRLTATTAGGDALVGLLARLVPPALPWVSLRGGLVARMTLIPENEAFFCLRRSCPLLAILIAERSEWSASPLLSCRLIRRSPASSSYQRRIWSVRSRRPYSCSDRVSTPCCMSLHKLVVHPGVRGLLDSFTLRATLC